MARSFTEMTRSFQVCFRRVKRIHCKQQSGKVFHKLCPGEQDIPGRGEGGKPSFALLVTQFSSYTGWMECMLHRKRRETKQQPSMLPCLVMPGCCLVSFLFLCHIHSFHSVLYDATQMLFIYTVLAFRFS